MLIEVKPNLTPAERCRYVAQLIRDNPSHFDMEDWFQSDSDHPLAWCEIADGGLRPEHYECGTTLCIAGFTVVSTPPEETPAHYLTSVQAALLLGMPQQQADEIFYSRTITPEGACQLLEDHANALDAGDVHLPSE